MVNCYPSWGPRRAEPPGPARFFDIVMLVAIVVVAVVVGSVIYDSGLWSDVSRFEAQQGLEGDTFAAPTLRARAIRADRELDALAPHPTSNYLDARIIGTHVNVSRGFPDADRGKHVRYEVQLMRLALLGSCDQGQPRHGWIPRS